MIFHYQSNSNFKPYPLTKKHKHLVTKNSPPKNPLFKASWNRYSGDSCMYTNVPPYGKSRIISLVSRGYLWVIPKNPKVKQAINTMGSTRTLGDPLIWDEPSHFATRDFGPDKPHYQHLHPKNGNRKNGYWPHPGRTSISTRDLEKLFTLTLLCPWQHQVFSWQIFSGTWRIIPASKCWIAMVIVFVP